MADDAELPLLEHLCALRRALLRSLAAVALALIPAFPLAPRVIRALTQWCLPPSLGQLHYFAPMEVFLIELEVGLLLALIAAFPWCAYQLWAFIVPALKPTEKRFLRCGALLSSILFLVGAAFCVGFILPLMMRFSASFASDTIAPTLGLAPFLHLAGTITLAFGLMFQLPLLVLAAVRLGLLSARKIRHARPYVWTLILILAALFTPPDVVSQLLLALPTGLLFELGLLAATKIDPHA